MFILIFFFFLQMRKFILKIKKNPFHLYKHINICSTEQNKFCQTYNGYINRHGKYKETQTTSSISFELYWTFDVYELNVKKLNIYIHLFTFRCRFIFSLQIQNKIKQNKKQKSIHQFGNKQWERRCLEKHFCIWWSSWRVRRIMQPMRKRISFK